MKPLSILRYISLMFMPSMLLFAACGSLTPHWERVTPDVHAIDLFELPNDSYGIEGNPAVIAIGGGEGYDDWAEKDRAVVVSTKEELLTALAAARSGDVIYVDDNVSINLTGEWDIRIRADVTLASGRGLDGSKGALLYTTANEDRILFMVRDSGVRLTGLRLEGPSIEETPDGCPENATGILVKGVAMQPITPSVEIDNNEMWGWPKTAISIAEMPGVHVHHNEIHHNRRSVESTTVDPVHGCEDGAYGLGYGVNISGTHVFVDANRFDFNRHDIASFGSPGSGYTARYNLILSHGTSHSFDMHGFGEQSTIGDKPPYDAGDRIVIHNNTFLGAEYPAIVIRGTPKTGAWIYQNQFARTEETIVQRNIDETGNRFYPPNTVNLHMEDNQYGVEIAPE